MIRTLAMLALAVFALPALAQDDDLLVGPTGLEGMENDFLVADEVPIFISEFQSSSPESAGLAGLMRDFLEGRVDDHPLLRTVSVYDAPRLGEYTALLYLQTCPPGEQVGCAYVVAGKLEAAYALVGVVHETEGQRSVELSVVDVVDGREAFSLQVGLELGGDDRLADGVVRLLVSIVEGRAGQLEDIRHSEDEPAAPTMDRDAVAEQLEALAQELGGVSNSRVDRKVDRPDYTLEDLVVEGESDAAKPWELLGMSSQEYLRFRNSGQTVHGWKQSQLGRRGQVILRPVVGPAWGPFNTRYFGIYAIDEDDFSLQETYAWQGFESGNGLSGGGWIGFGIAPSFEIDVGGGVNWGRYTMYVRRQEGLEPPAERRPDTEQQLNSWAGVRVLSIRRFTEPVRPIVGVGVLWRKGHPYTDYWEAISTGSGGGTMPTLGAPSTMEVQAIPGVELQLSDAASLAVSLPVGIGVGGLPFDVHQEEAGIIQVEDANTLGRFSVALELSLVVHLFGPEVKVEDLYLDEMDEF